MVTSDRPASARDAASSSHPLDASAAWGDDEPGFFRAVADAAWDAIFVIDETNTIRYVNPSVARILGHDPEELVGNPLGDLIPERLQATQSNALTRYLHSRERTLDWNGVEFPGLHADGHEVDLEISFREALDGGERYFVGFVRDVTDATSRERERAVERSQRIVDTVGDGIYQLDREGRFVWVNDVISEVTGYDRDELVGEPVTKVLDPPAIRRSQELIESLVADDEAVGVVEFDVQTAAGEVVPTEARIALVRGDGDIDGTVGVVRDISERENRKRQLESQRDELEALNQINGVIRGVNRSLVDATTRSEIEETVCRQLSESDLYQFTWIGDHDASASSLRPRVVASVEESFVQSVVDASTTDVAETPEGRALRTGECQVVRSIADDAEFSEDCRAASIDHGCRSMGAFPLEFGAVNYGVLAVYSGRDRAFGDREATVVAELAETVGLAINAVESRRALQADTVTEFELEIETADHTFAEVAKEVGSTLTLKGTIPTSDGLLVQYFSSPGSAPQPVLDLLEGKSAVTAARTVRETAEGCLFEVVSSAGEIPSIVPLIADHGAKIRTVTANDGSLHVVGETVHPTQLRTIVEGCRERFSGAALKTVRERDRPVQSRENISDSVGTRLTDRQRAVLRAAYLGGYFKTSRDSTGTELAASLDISSATFHQHLQAGLGKVLGDLFEQSGAG